MRLRKDQTVPDNVKVLFLERLLKNIYHCKEIEYIIDGPNDDFATIFMVDLNDDPFKAPKLHDCCDLGIEYEVDTEIVPDEIAIEYAKEEQLVLVEGKDKRVRTNLEVCFYYDPYTEIEKLKKEKDAHTNPAPG